MLLKESKKLLLKDYEDFTTAEGQIFLSLLKDKQNNKAQEYLYKLCVGDHQKLKSICDDLEKMKFYGIIDYNQKFLNKTLESQILYNEIPIDFNVLGLTDDMRKILEEANENRED